MWAKIFRKSGQISHQQSSLRPPRDVILYKPISISRTCVWANRGRAVIYKKMRQSRTKKTTMRVYPSGKTQRNHIAIYKKKMADFTLLKTVRGEENRQKRCLHPHLFVYDRKMVYVKDSASVPSTPRPPPPPYLAAR